ncbi:hypothetical protein ACG97_05875 [Vogesella sp. EB]|uniref:addiction module antidote protein n=1 Tax=Vogesella sp. EB TaxID=1526735 RepID=UPI00065D1438|nr:addiction module antidote protein [Vogesella sp. EB]KMJ53777.1 hypothetical protein ACG97_05875 [Vogesella sp. EB]
MTSRSHDEWLREQLASDHEFMVEYLQAAFEESDTEDELLLALRAVVEAKGISKVAKTSGVKRESLSRALSPGGNPTLHTLAGVFKTLGLKISVHDAQGNDHDHPIMA